MAVMRFAELSPRIRRRHQFEAELFADVALVLDGDFFRQY